MRSVAPRAASISCTCAGPRSGGTGVESVGEQRGRGGVDEHGSVPPQSAAHVQGPGVGGRVSKAWVDRKGVWMSRAVCRLNHLHAQSAGAGAEVLKVWVNREAREQRSSAFRRQLKGEGCETKCVGAAAQLGLREAVRGGEVESVKQGERGAERQQWPIVRAVQSALCNPRSATRAVKSGPT
eukprot:364196-Chlamydomonas_euryale.AAC.4